MTKTALILGPSGKVARHIATAFANRGWEVRPYKRGTDMNTAAQGCDVIVNGMNPPNYHNWDVIIPQITAQVIAAAKASGATVIVPGSVYAYGNQPGPWDENTPMRPVARKGEIRKQMELAYRKAADEGVRVIMLHSGDFIDPDTATDTLSLIFLRALKSGKFTAPGKPDVRRAYIYLPDLGEAAARLAELPGLPNYIDVPVSGLTASVNELKAETERQTGKQLKLVNFPWWFMKLASPFWEMARELSEMRYLYETDHSLSGKRLAQLLPDFRFVPIAKALESAVAQNR